ncbi:MAG: DMT family transporter [Oscillospiraceae bacterium]|nr:DMT family transporter [Oscillospiraceae bacterium]
MYYFLSLLTGILISVMVAFNGGLTTQYGVYSATIIVHIAGLIFIAFLVFINRERVFAKKCSWFLYLGGAIGVLTTVFNNMAFGSISVSAILALGLFGQSVAGLLMDQYGLFNMPKHPFSKRKILGLFLIICGIVSMINNFEILAVVVSFIAGVTIVISRTLNAKLATLTSVRVSAFYNYLIGLGISIPVFLIFGHNEIALTEFTFSSNIYIYLGGILGVGVVLLSNIVVVKISSFYLTLLIFIGQVFSGILIDVIITHHFSARILIGGILVSIGLCVNLMLDKRDMPGEPGQANA